jgi:DNA-binding beta-propeller fold protein YncE
MIARSGNGDGLVNAPRSIHLATNNKIYVSDSGRHRIQVFDRNGTFVKKFGQSGSGNGEFNQPYGITSTNNGDIYVVDRYNHRVQVFDGNGTFIRKFGSYGSLEGQINQPIDIAVTAANQIAVLDYINRRVVYFSASGQFVKHHSTHSHEEFIGNLPNGLIATTRNNIFNLYDANGNRIKTGKKWEHFPLRSHPCQTDQSHGSTTILTKLILSTHFRTIRPKVSKEIPFPELFLSLSNRGSKSARCYFSN